MSRCVFCDRERNAGAREINPCSAGCGRWPCDGCADLAERCPDCATRIDALDLAPGLRVAVEIAKDRLAALRAHDSDAMRARPAAVAAIEDVIVFLEAAADRTSRGEHPHARTPLT